MNTIPPPELSLVIPCYNEGEMLPLLRDRLEKSLGAMNTRTGLLNIEERDGG